jgi:predicted RNA-binding Zn ribbon-like protein
VADATTQVAGTTSEAAALPDPHPDWPEPVGGWLCLDVANSLEGRHKDVPDDRLRTYADLVHWVARAGGLTADQVAALLALAADDPNGARRELRRAADVRDAVFRTFHGLATAGRTDPADLAVVQESHAEGLRHARLVPGAPTFTWAWEPDLRLVRWLVARSAVELATAGPLARVKACASEEGCQYLFVDTSKNGSRRWCSMAHCGNQAKARALTERRRARRPTAR